MLFRRWLDSTAARCERTVMLGFYSIRKLTESGKLSDFLVGTKISVLCYPPTGTTVTKFNNLSPERHYHLDRPQSRRVGLLFLCNQFIHSHVYGTVHEEDWRLTKFWVSSDRERSKQLFEIPVQSVAEVFETVGKDEVIAMSANFDAKKGDYVLRNFRTVVEYERAMGRPLNKGKN